jgi:hypothetical protein
MREQITDQIAIIEKEGSFERVVEFESVFFHLVLYITCNETNAYILAKGKHCLLPTEM